MTSHSRAAICIADRQKLVPDVFLALPRTRRAPHRPHSWEQDGRIGSAARAFQTGYLNLTSPSAHLTPPHDSSPALLRVRSCSSPSPLPLRCWISSSAFVAAKHTGLFRYVSALSHFSALLGISPCLHRTWSHFSPSAAVQVCVSQLHSHIAPIPILFPITVHTAPRACLKLSARTPSLLSRCSIALHVRISLIPSHSISSTPHPRCCTPSSRSCSRCLAVALALLYRALGRRRLHRATHAHVTALSSDLAVLAY